MGEKVDFSSLAKDKGDRQWMKRQKREMTHTHLQNQFRKLNVKFSLRLIVWIGEEKN